MVGMGYVTSGPAADAAVRAGLYYQNGDWFLQGGIPVSERAADAGVAWSQELYNIFTNLGYSVAGTVWRPIVCPRAADGSMQQMFADGCHPVFDGSLYADPAAALVARYQATGVPVGSVIPDSAKPYQNAGSPNTVTPSMVAPSSAGSSYVPSGQSFFDESVSLGSFNLPMWGLLAAGVGALFLFGRGR